MAKLVAPDLRLSLLGRMLGTDDGVSEGMQQFECGGVRLDVFKRKDTG